MVKMAKETSYWKAKNVFVTGCTGIVGSWLAKTLVDSGANVTGLVRDFITNTYLENSGYHKKINRVFGQLEDYNVLLRTINEYEIDTVFHLGAQTIVGKAFNSPLLTFEANIKGTWNILEACRQAGKVNSVIIASSDKAYGEHENLPYKETFELNGRHPYDASKSCADILSQAYFQTYGLPVAISRCGNIYGGGDFNFNRLIPGTMLSLIRNEEPIIRTDGLFLRDYVYVKDAVNAYLMLGQNAQKSNVKGQAFNFGTGKPVNVIDLVNMMIKISGKSYLKPKILNIAKSEIKNQYLSSEKAGKILDWKPEFGLSQGLKETYSWYEEYFKSGSK